MIRLVPLEQVDNVWPIVAPWIEQACLKARSDRTMPQLYAQCRGGALWLAIAISGHIQQAVEDYNCVGVAIMSISEAEGERLLQHVIVAGKGDTDVWFEELITWDWITMMGVKRVVSEGRDGWVRRLKPLIPSIKPVRQVFEWRHDDVIARKGH